MSNVAPCFKNIVKPHNGNSLFMLQKGKKAKLEENNVTIPAMDTDSRTSFDSSRPASPQSEVRTYYSKVLLSRLLCYSDHLFLIPTIKFHCFFWKMLLLSPTHYK